MTHQAAITWLKVSSITLVVLGALFSWGTIEPLAHFTLSLIDFIIFPMDGAQSFAATETRLLTAISGGLTAGFGMAIYMMTVHIYTSDKAVGGRMILATTFTWFVVDGIGSVLAGVTFNVFANVTFLIMIALPVMLAARSKKTSTA